MLSADERHPHLAEMFNSYQLRLGTVELAQRLDESLADWPWTVAGIDWENIGQGASITLGELVLDANFLERSGFHVCSIAAALLRPSEPPIIGSPAVILSCIDQIFWKYPGARYIFGCSQDGVDHLPLPDVLAEYDGADTLKFIKRDTLSGMAHA